MKSVKRILGLILVSIMLMAIAIPASAEASADLLADFDALERVKFTDFRYYDASVLENLSLPQKGASGNTTITWSSSDSAVINPETGVLTRPALTKNVNLTATITDGEDNEMTKVFSIRVPGTKDAPSEILQFDSFDDGVLSGAIEKGTHSADVMEANGALDLAGKNSAGTHTGTIYLTEGRDPVTGKFAVEFRVSRSNATAYANHPIRFTFAGSGGESAMFIQWGMNQTSTVYWYDQSGVLNTVAPAYADYITSMQVRAEFDTTTRTISLWIDGKQVMFGENDYSYFGSNAKDITKVDLLGWGGDSKMDCFRVIDLAPDQTVDMLYRDSFADGEADSRVDSSTMEESKGALRPINPAVASSVSIYPKTDKSGATGNFTMELELTRAKAVDTTTIFFWNAATNQRFLIVNWYAAQVATIPAFNVSGPTTTGLNSATNLHIKAEFNTTEGTLSLWLNGIQVMNNATKYQANATDIGLIAISVPANSDTAVGQFKYYTEKSTPATPAITELSLDYNAFDKQVIIHSPVAKTAKLFAASYAGEGDNTSLVGVLPLDVTLTEGGSIVADASALSVNGATKIKLFLWSETGLQPICGEFISNVASAY